MGQPGLNPSPAAGWTVEPARPAHLARAAAIHRQALGYSLNARLGEAHLAYLYRRILAHPGSTLQVACRAGEVGGLVCATLDAGQLAAWLTAELGLAGWAGYALRILARPGLWGLAWAALRAGHTIPWQGRPLAACLTVIAVAPQARRSGAGRALVAAVDDFMGRQAQPLYWLETEAANQAARAFYAGLGFEPAGKRGSAVLLVRRVENRCQN